MPLETMTGQSERDRNKRATVRLEAARGSRNPRRLQRRERQREETDMKINPPMENGGSRHTGPCRHCGAPLVWGRCVMQCEKERKAPKEATNLKKAG